LICRRSHDAPPKATEAVAPITSQLPPHEPPLRADQAHVEINRLTTIRRKLIQTAREGPVIGQPRPANMRRQITATKR
jgi:hypothetical protein